MNCPNCGASLRFLFAEPAVREVIEPWFRNLQPVEDYLERFHDHVTVFGKQPTDAQRTETDALVCPKCHGLVVAFGERGLSPSLTLGRHVIANVDYALEVAQ